MKFKKGQKVKYVIPSTNSYGYEALVFSSFINKAGRELIRFEDEHGNLQTSRADCWELVKDVPQDDLFQ